MMLMGGGLRVALATTHLALKDVPSALTREGLEGTLRILRAELTRRFGIAAAAGIGRRSQSSQRRRRLFRTEENRGDRPGSREAARRGFSAHGPLPADTLFVPAQLANADCVLAMYHDQGLPVAQVRELRQGNQRHRSGCRSSATSVDHGTALELAGTGRAEPESLFAAVEAAIGMAQAQARR